MFSFKLTQLSRLKPALKGICGAVIVTKFISYNHTLCDKKHDGFGKVEFEQDMKEVKAQMKQVKREMKDMSNELKQELGDSFGTSFGNAIGGFVTGITNYCLSIVDYAIENASTISTSSGGISISTTNNGNNATVSNGRSIKSICDGVIIYVTSNSYKGAQINNNIIEGDCDISFDNGDKVVSYIPYNNTIRIFTQNGKTYKVFGNVSINGVKTFVNGKLIDDIKQQIITRDGIILFQYGNNSHCITERENNIVKVYDETKLLYTIDSNNTEYYYNGSNQIQFTIESNGTKRYMGLIT